MSEIDFPAGRGEHTKDVPGSCSYSVDDPRHASVAVKVENKERCAEATIDEGVRGGSGDFRVAVLCTHAQARNARRPQCILGHLPGRGELWSRPTDHNALHAVTQPLKTGSFCALLYIAMT